MKKKLTFKEQLKKTKWWHWFIMFCVVGLIGQVVGDDYGLEPKPTEQPTQTQKNYVEFVKNKIEVLTSEWEDLHNRYLGCVVLQSSKNYRTMIDNSYKTQEKLSNIYTLVKITPFISEETYNKDLRQPYENTEQAFREQRKGLSNIGC